MGGRRSETAFLAPGALTFTFILLDSAQPFWDRLMTAFVMGIIIQGVGFIAMIVASAIAVWLCGEESQKDTPSMRQLLPGVLLATCVWIMWQHNRDEVVADLATCVQQALKEDPSTQARDAVFSCYEDGNDDDFGREFDF